MLTETQYRRLVRPLTSSTSSLDALARDRQDYLQDVKLHVWLKARDREPAYQYVTARNYVRDCLASQRVHRARAIERDQQFAALAPRVSDGVRDLENRDAVGYIKQALGEEGFGRLVDVVDSTVTEVAQLWGVARGTAYRHIDKLHVELEPIRRACER